MLNTVSLFEMQNVLDQRIIKERNMKHDRSRITVLALLVEIGECANETRCFKDWSDKPASENHVILEEYVDGLHFVLSIGLNIGYDSEYEWNYLRERIESECKGTERVDGDELTQAFTDTYQDVLDFSTGELTYPELISGFVQLGLKIGFNIREIESAYFYKNNKNHQRQTEGY